MFGRQVSSSDESTTLPSEALGTIQTERAVTKGEWRQMSERVDALAQMLNSERQMRDHAIKGVEGQLASLRDMLEIGTGIQGQDLTLPMLAIQESKAKHEFDMNSTIEKIETFQRHVTGMLQDQQVELAGTSESIQNRLQVSDLQINQVRTDLENSALDIQVRLAQVEEQYGALEEQHAHFSQSLESLRLEGSLHQNQMQAALTQMSCFESGLQDRRIRNEPVRGYQASVVTEHVRQVSELEGNIARHFGREVNERNSQDVIDEVRRTVPSSSGSWRSCTSLPLRDLSTQAQAVSKGGMLGPAMAPVHCSHPSHGETTVPVASLKSPLGADHAVTQTTATPISKATVTYVATPPRSLSAERNVLVRASGGPILRQA